MIDDKDRQIINILLEKGREPSSSISEKLGISVPTVIDRIKKMQEEGIITGFKVVVDHKKMGLELSALITIISDSSDNFSEIINKSRTTPEIINCFSTTGSGSHVIEINTENTDSLESLLRKIQGWSSVKRTETQIILSSHKN